MENRFSEAREHLQNYKVNLFSNNMVNEDFKEKMDCLLDEGELQNDKDFYNI